MLGRRRASSYWKQAATAYHHGQSEKAQKLFEKSLAANDDVADSWLGLHALGVNQSSALENLAAHFENFGDQRTAHNIGLDSTYWLTPHRQTRLRTRQDLCCALAVHYLANNDVTQATRFANLATEHDYQWSFVQALLCEREDDVPSAIAHLEAILGRDERLDVTVRMKLGNLEAQMGNLAQAEKHLTEVTAMKAFAAERIKAHRALRDIAAECGEDFEAERHERLANDLAANAEKAPNADARVSTDNPLEAGTLPAGSYAIPADLSQASVQQNAAESGPASAERSLQDPLASAQRFAVPPNSLRYPRAEYTGDGAIHWTLPGASPQLIAAAASLSTAAGTWPKRTRRAKNLGSVTPVADVDTGDYDARPLPIFQHVNGQAPRPSAEHPTDPGAVEHDTPVSLAATTLPSAGLNDAALTVDSEVAFPKQPAGATSTLPPHSRGAAPTHPLDGDAALGAYVDPAYALASQMQAVGSGPSNPLGDADNAGHHEASTASRDQAPSSDYDDVSEFIDLRDTKPEPERLFAMVATSQATMKPYTEGDQDTQVVHRTRDESVNASSPPTSPDVFGHPVDGSSTSVPEALKQPLTLSEALQGLDDLTGLAAPKAQLRGYLARARAHQVRLHRGLKTQEFHENLVFVGPPGSGKTSVAEAFAPVLAAAGVAASDAFAMADATHHDAEIAILSAFEDARNGVVLIANLDRGQRLHGADWLQRALRNAQHRTVIIAHGSTETHVRGVLESLGNVTESFETTVTFAPYTAAELADIAVPLAARSDSDLDDPARAALREALAERVVSQDHAAEPMVLVRRLLERAEQARDERLFSDITADPTEGELRLITAEDVRTALAH